MRHLEKDRFGVGLVKAELEWGFLSKGFVEGEVSGESLGMKVAEKVCWTGSHLSRIPQRTQEYEWCRRVISAGGRGDWVLVSLCLLIPGELPCVPTSWCVHMCGNF